MANNIVQHRRGTTEEWEKLDLVPSEGELVIEECADGTCKCKIGNGISKFSELAYLSDPLNARAIDLLTEQHQEDIISIVDKLTKLKDDLKTDLKCLETNTETRINALFVDELRLNVNTLISNVEQLENTVEAAKTVSTDKFKKLEEDLVELHNIVLELPVDSSINESIENASQEVLTQVNEKIQAEKASYEAKASKAHAKLEKDLVDLRNNLTELRSTFSVQLVELQDNLSTLVDIKLNNAIPELDSKINTLEDKLDEQESRLLFKIQDTYSKINKNYGSRIIALQESLAALEEETEKAFSTLTEGLEDLAHSVSKRFGIIEEDIHEVHGLCEDAMSKVAQVRTENELWHLTLNGSISNINSRLDEITSSHIAELEAAIAELEVELLQAASAKDLENLDSKVREHLANHEGIGILVDITEKDIKNWRETSHIFLERYGKALYIADDNKLYTGEDLLEAVVLDCGTA